MRTTFRILAAGKFTGFSLIAALTVAAMSLCSNAAAAPPASAITFDEAWQQAVLRNDLLAAEQSNAERAQLLYEATRGLYFPRIDLNASYQQLDDPVTLDALDFNPLVDIASDPLGEALIDQLGGPENFKTELSDDSFGRVAISGIWPLYTGGRITAVRQAAQSEAEIADALAATQKRLLFEELVRVYFGVTLAQTQLAIRQQHEDSLQHHLRNATLLQEQGQIAEVERLVVAAAHDRAAVATKRAQRELEIVRLGLMSLLHEDREMQPSDPLFVNNSIPPDGAFVQATLADNPLLRSLQAQRAESEAVLQAQRGRFHPEFFAFADYEVYKDDSIAFELLPDWQVGVGMNFTLLDRVGRGRSVEAAHKTQDAVGRLELGTRRTLTLTTRVAHRGTLQAIEEYAGLESSVRLADETLRLREKAFTQGLSTSTELLDAQLFVALIQAEQALAAHHYVSALGRLLALGGNMDEFADYQVTAQKHSLTEGTPDQ